MKKIFGLLLIFGAISASAQVSLNKSTSPYFKNQVERGLALLPQAYLGSAKGLIVIEEATLYPDRFMGEDLCNLDSRVQFGLTRKNRNDHSIQISSRLVELAQKVRTRFDCSHGTFEKLLQATIIHELTHVKDNVEKISLDPDFQRIVGVKKVGRNSKKKVLNMNADASPDAYEFKNLEEALAVNVEYLLMDSEYECRRPATSNFLSKKLGVPLKRKCEKNYNILTQSAYLEDNYQHTLSIHPNRIYQIHYLFAGRGQALMSRWGHAMFRLVVCAPHRKTVGPECLRDVSHHVALSYRAYMSEINISYAKGMFGAYPSQLFIMRFHEVQQEYTKFELRDLYSIPLRMNEEQKREFIDLTLERFWSYQGKYYFLDNNCGTETQKHLAVALEEDQSKLIRSLTPLKIYNDIIKEQNNLSEEKLQYTMREELVQRGFLVTSLQDELDSTYQFLRSMGLFHHKNLSTFLKKTSAGNRLADYQRVLPLVDLPLEQKKIFILRLIYLERYLATRFILGLPKKALAQMNKDPELKAEVIKMGESLKTLATQPWEVVRGEYGVPLKEEFNRLYPKFLRELSETMKDSAEKQMSDLQSLLGKKYFAEDLQEIEHYKKIKQLTNELFIEASKF
jgi:hypothetical protein